MNLDPDDPAADRLDRRAILPGLLKRQPGMGRKSLPAIMRDVIDPEFHPGR